MTLTYLPAPTPTIRPVVAPRGGRPEVSLTVPGDEHDRRLAARLVAGDESALREVYREYSPAVLGLATRVIGDRNFAEDVMQDVFVRLWEQPERFDPARGRLRAYLLATTHSRAVERVRAEDSRRRRNEAAGRAQALVAYDDATGAVDADQTRIAVRRALATLPAEQREAIEMAYYQGLSYRDVATALDQPEGTVKYRIRVGMQKLRAALRAVEVSP